MSHRMDIRRFARAKIRDMPIYDDLHGLKE
jgi:hypothetical protein